MSSLPTAFLCKTFQSILPAAGLLPPERSSTSKVRSYFLAFKSKRINRVYLVSSYNHNVQAQTLGINLTRIGGCFVVTSRILVVDLLTKNLDASRVDGMLVYNAHNVTEASSHAFALRMYRDKQPNGFVKAITNAASSLSMGFGKLREVMTSCGVDQLSLWYHPIMHLYIFTMYMYVTSHVFRGQCLFSRRPRFHVTVKEFLSKSAPEVLELAQSLSPLAGRVQNKLVLLLELNLKELQRCANVDLSDLISGKQGSGTALDVVLRRRLDKQWHTLSDKTKALISDVKTLQSLLANLLTFDPTTFHLLAENVKREATQFSAVPRVSHRYELHTSTNMLQITEWNS